MGWNQRSVADMGSRKGAGQTSTTFPRPVRISINPENYWQTTHSTLRTPPYAMDVFGTIMNAVALGDYIYRTFNAMETSDEVAPVVLAEIKLQLLTMKRFLRGCRRFTANTLNKKEREVVAEFCSLLMPRLELVQSIALKYQKSRSIESTFFDKARWAIFKKSELEAVSVQLSQWASTFNKFFNACSPKERERIFGDSSDEDEWKDQSIIDTVDAIQLHAVDPKSSKAAQRAVFDEKLKRARKMRRSEDVKMSWNSEFCKLRMPDGSKMPVLQEMGREQDSICLLSELLQHANPFTMGLLRSPGYTKGFLDPNNTEPVYRLLFELPGHLNWDQGNPIENLQQKLAKKPDNSLSSIPSLDERLALARTITTAVYYLHCVGFVHKDINPKAIRFLTALGEQYTVRPSELSGRALGHPFLMQFGAARIASRKTSSIGPTMTDKLSSAWFEICTHPDRTRNDDPSRVFYQMCYDKYSLGVLLLAIGCWKDLSKEPVIMGLLPDWKRFYTRLEEYAEHCRAVEKGRSGQDRDIELDDGLWMAMTRKMRTGEFKPKRANFSDPEWTLPAEGKRELKLERRKAIRAHLQEMARTLLPASFGTMYRDIVLNCLSVERDDPYTADSLMTDVLGRLWAIKLQVG